MKQKKDKIYLDYAATTPLDPQVLETMMPYFQNNFGNAASLHSFGQEAIKGVDQARDKIAEFLGCSAQEIIFTSGATEADNLAIQGILKKLSQRAKKPHLITSNIEHPAVLDVCQAIDKQNLAEVDYAPVNKQGLVEVEVVQRLIKENTALVSIMYVNNEIGTIQPIRDIGKMIEKINQDRKLKIYFHTDAVQAANYLNCKVDYLHVDLLSLSGHKIYGPKGIGVLYIRQNTLISQILYGGEHEYGLRPGTLNTPAVVGFGRAIELLRDKEKVNQEIKRYRDKLLEGILAKVPEVTVNGDLEQRVVSNLNVSFKNVEGESLVLMLDMAGIAVSTGSACASGSLKPSYVLLALGLSHQAVHGSIRFALGKETREKDVKKVLEVLPEIIKRLRDIAPR